MLKMSTSSTQPLVASHSFLALYPIPRLRRTPSPNYSFQCNPIDVYSPVRNGIKKPNSSSGRRIYISPWEPGIVTQNLAYQNKKWVKSEVDCRRITSDRTGKLLSRTHSPCSPQSRGDSGKRFDSSTHLNVKLLLPTDNKLGHTTSNKRMSCSADVLPYPEYSKIFDFPSSRPATPNGSISNEHTYSYHLGTKPKNCFPKYSFNCLFSSPFLATNNKISPLTDIVFKFEDISANDSNHVGYASTTELTDSGDVAHNAPNTRLDLNYLATPSRRPSCYGSPNSNSSISSISNTDSCTSASSSPSEALSFVNKSKCDDSTNCFPQQNSINCINSDHCFYSSQRGCSTEDQPGSPHMRNEQISPSIICNYNHNNSNDDKPTNVPSVTSNNRRMLVEEEITEPPYPAGQLETLSRGQNIALARSPNQPDLQVNAVEEDLDVTSRAGGSSTKIDAFPNPTTHADDQADSSIDKSKLDNSIPHHHQHHSQTLPNAISSSDPIVTCNNKVTPISESATAATTTKPAELPPSKTPSKHGAIKFAPESLNKKTSSSSTIMASSVTSIGGRKRVPGGVASNAVGLPDVRASSSSPSNRRQESAAFPSIVSQQPLNATALNKQDKKCCFCWCGCCKCAWAPGQDRKNSLRKREQSKHGSISVSESAPITYEEVKSWEKSFDRLMKTTNGRNVFQEFLKHEYSEENMLFWRACEEMKKETSQEAIDERARTIYEDYISILSPKEVSLDSRVRELINQKMVEPSKDTFDEAQLQIYTLMHRDSFPRFINSLFYRRLLDQYKPQTTTAA